jgi:hypothetical protein
MKWTRLDEEAFASEIPGAGCFVKFYTGHVCFVPNVTIEVDAQAKGRLRATVFSHLVFSTTGTRTTGWVGNAGDALDKKLAEHERKQWRADKKAKNQAVNHSGKWPKWPELKVIAKKLKAEHERKEDAHTCPHCQRGFKWAALLQKHVAIEHKK